MSLSKEDLATLAAFIGTTVDERLARFVAPSVPPLAAPVVPSPAVPVVVAEKKERKVPTSEQLAADASDPLCSDFTTLVRFGHNRDLYVKLWTQIRDQFKASGQHPGYASPGKAAQALYGARLKMERDRLAARDRASGLTAVRIPVVDPNRIHSNMPAADPTGNAAVQAVSAAERIAALQAELAALQSPMVPTNPLAELQVAVQPKERSAASVAQSAVGANPTQRTLDKLVRDAKASGKPAEFVLSWLKAASETTRKRRQGMARQALQVLGVQLAK